MFCSNCGMNVPDDSIFCENCGAQLEPLEPAEEPVDFAAGEPAEEYVEEEYIEEEPVEEYAEEEPVEEYIEEEPVKEYVEEEYIEEEPAEEYVEEEYIEEEPVEEYTEEEYVFEEPAEEYTEEEYVEELELEEEIDISEIEELESMEEVEYDEDDTVEYDPDNIDISEIEELEAMEEVEYDEDAYYEEDYEEFDEEPAAAGADLPEEVELPPIDDFEMEETGQPEGSEAEWLESFQQLEPKEEDWIEEPAEEFVEEPVEEEVTDEPEFIEEPERVEEPAEEFVEEPVEEEVTDEPEFIEEPERVEEPVEEEFIEEPEFAEEPAEEFVDEPEFIEEPELAEQPVEEEPAAEAEAPLVPAETETDEAADEESKLDEAREAVSDGAKKVGAWLGSIGKQVHTGTGWAVDVAKEKATKIKDDKKLKNEKKSERDRWSEEEEGELDLGYNFWYKSNQADTSSRYEGMDLEDEEDKDFARDDATTYVAVKGSKTKTTEGEETETETDSETEEGDGQAKEKKPVNKLKVTVIALVIAALLGAGGVYGSKVYTENKQQDAYQASLTKAEKSIETKDYAAAEKIYQDLLKEYPDRPELYEALTKLYITEEKYEDAKNVLNEGIARTGKSKAFSALAEDLDALTSTEWQEPYRRILADNEWAVRQYEDTNGSCVALCDITGDKRPEMIYFTQEYYGYGVLHLCVYENDKVNEITYECSNRGTQYDDAFYDVENDDAGYIVYKSKTDGKFGIYNSIMLRGVEWDTTNLYTLEGTDCKRDAILEAGIKTSYRVSDDEENVDNNEYTLNDKNIKYKEYNKQWMSILEDIDKVIITSENTAGDREIWNRTMDIEEEAMTYDGAMKILDEDAR